MRFKRYYKKLLIFVSFIFFVLLSAFSLYQYQKIQLLNYKVKSLEADRELLSKVSKEAQTEIVNLKSDDQYVKNKLLEEEVKNIHETFATASAVFEKLNDLKAQNVTDKKLNSLYVTSLAFLSQKNFSSASGLLAQIVKQIEELQKAKNEKLLNLANIETFSSPPQSGYRRQKVTVDGSTFAVDIITADLSSTRVIVDTASSTDCHDSCPVLSLVEYVSRNGAFAAINGSYFCPESYPSCSGKKNSFDTLLMNKNKTYFNSDNNVYSTVPAVIFQGSSVRFVGQSLEWGRDTSVDGVIANYPLLVSGGNIAFSSSGDSKINSKGNRSFVGASGSTVYIGIVHSASVAESAKVLHALGIASALNLDDGGSTALWYGGYKAGPGRNLPNAILFVRK